MRAALAPLAAPAALLAAVLALGGIDCSVYLGTCMCAHCCTNGTCSSGPWSGTVCRCGTGDPELPDVDNKCTYLPPWPAPNGNARSTWRSAATAGRSTACLTLTPTSPRGRTAAAGADTQAIITPDNKAIVYRDGPEPDPQPAFACNGSPDLWWPWGCERYAVEERHRAC
jgi:hypothetical protein